MTILDTRILNTSDIVSTSLSHGRPLLVDADFAKKNIKLAIAFSGGNFWGIRKDIPVL
jgi:hypothetical protein